MNSSSEFSEAAKLYAENFQVVEAMRAAFDAEVAGFYDHMRALVQRRLPQTLHEKTTPGFRYWWMGGDVKMADRQPRLWFDVRKTEVVAPGKWELVAGAPEAGPEELARLAALALDDTLRPSCIPGSGGCWSLFTLSLTTNGAKLTGLAADIGDVLAALHEAHRDFVE